MTVTNVRTALQATARLCVAAILLSPLPTAAGSTESRDTLQLPEGWTAEGTVQTVTGPIAPEEVGFTLPHEHLFINFFEPTSRLGYRLTGEIPLPAKQFMQSFGLIYVPDTEAKQQFWDREAVDLPMIAQMRADALAGRLNGYMNKTIAILDSDMEAAEELARFAGFGGRTVVDVTVEGLGREPLRLQRLARNSGVNIVMGTGWYRWPFHDPSIEALSIDQLAQIMVDDITKGVHGTDARAGIIGEIPIDPTSVAIEGDLLSADKLAARRIAQAKAAAAPGAQAEDVFDARELRVLRAAARASRSTGAAITLHYATRSLAPLDILAEEGADLRRVVVGHADGIMLDPGLLEAMLARGVTLEVDYGLQYVATTGPVNPSQRSVLDATAAAILAGHAEQIMLSLDLCTRLGRRSHGGGGLGWIHEHVLPYLRSKGVTEAQIQQITVGNPTRLLTFAKPTIEHAGTAQ